MTLITTGSKIKAYSKCERSGYLQYAAENGTAVKGWERRALSMPLATGIYTHEGTEALLRGQGVNAAINAATSAYVAEIEARGLAADGESTGYNDVVEEQVAMVEALVRGFDRVVLPRLSDEYDLSLALIEQELTVPLSDDVTLAARIDLAAPRKADGRWFLFNWKTCSEAGERWLRGFETDMQLVTETLALEALIGEPVAGVNVLGMVKGQRVGVDDRLVEVRGEGKKASSYIQRSKLLYGYKCEPNPPLHAGGYDWESTTKKGWGKFRAYREDFGAGRGLEYWVNWMPEEVVAGAFIWVPTIWVEQARREAKVKQIVAIERRMAFGVKLLEEGIMGLDDVFVQSESACQQYGANHRCGCFDACWTNGVQNDIGGSGLYQPRSANHPVESE